MADFNAEVKAIFDQVDAFFATVRKDLAALLGIVEQELPKLEEVLSVAASLTALVPGIGAYTAAADSAIKFVEDLVKTLDGVLMPAGEAARIVGVRYSPATDPEKRGFAVAMLQQSFPEVPTNTHDLHISIAYAKVAKIQAAG